ncbi:NUDIX domain-containing protein [Patescibacteria group bacterium]|nr:NUDIX domain-containing protein [Patescibacteria group bacterium]
MKRVILKDRPRGFRSTGIVVKDNKLLLMKQVFKGEAFFTMPGGGWEENETLEDTCKREVMEEFTIEVVVGRCVYLLDSKTRINFVFECEYVSGNPELGGPEKERMNENDQYEVMWVDIEDARNLNIAPKETKKALFKYLDNRNVPTFFETIVKTLNKNILLVSPQNNKVPPDGYGGIERIVAEAYKYYTAEGYEVDVISKEGSKYHTCTMDSLEDLNLGKYRFIINYEHDEEVVKKLTNSGRRVFVILENNFAKKLMYVKDVDDAEFFVISPSQQKQYRKNLGITLDIKPNSIDTDFFRITGTYRAKDIVYIGGFGQQKSLISCIEYAKKHDLSIDFYGKDIFIDSEREYQKEFMKAVGEYNKASILHEVNDAEKVKLLNGYKYFIFLPSVDKDTWVEPFGIAPLEALACGCTVITQFDKGGHLSFCTRENSISYEDAPKTLDPEKVRGSVLKFDYRSIFKTYYPK